MKIQLILLTLWVMASCSTTGLPGKPTASWKSSPPPGLDRKLTSGSAYKAVAMAVQGMAASDAEKQLVDAAFVLIPGNEVERFLGAGKTLDGEGAYYILRAVWFEEVGGGFGVFQIGSQTLVTFGAMGANSGKIQNCAVIARLPTAPSVVFCEAFIDE